MDAEILGLSLRETLGLIDGDSDAEGETLADSLGDSEALMLTDSDGLNEADSDGLLLADKELDGETAPSSIII